MPKIKTHKGTAKRIKITGKGKLKKQTAFRSHLREKKSSKRKRKYSKLENINKHDIKKIKKLLPNI